MEHTLVDFRRAIRLGDGFVLTGSFDAVVNAARRLRGVLDDADSAVSGHAFGIEAILNYSVGTSDLARHVRLLSAEGVTHVAVRTLEAGLTGPSQHMEALHNAMRVLLNGH